MQEALQQHEVNPLKPPLTRKLPLMTSCPSQAIERPVPLLPWRDAMAGKKDYDATKNLPEGEPTQTLPKGTKTGLPRRRSVFAALDKIAKGKTKT
jgi:hypothetical protein